MVNLYRKGRIAEKKVVNWLQSHGFYNLRRSKGSRGPYDIRGRSPSGTKAYIQEEAEGFVELYMLLKREFPKIREIIRGEIQI